MTVIDAYAGTRNLIENAFSYLTWHKDACAVAGIKGISQVWKDEPAWYFWLESVTGGFLLRLHDEEPVNKSQYVSLSVHYYPPREEGAAWQLSAEEQRLLGDGEIFDLPTSTPRFEQFETCLPYFIAAEIGLTLAPDNQLQMIVYSSAKGLQHPSIKLLDLLVSALNFETGTHHRQALQLGQGDDISLFLVYDTTAFEDFLHHFELSKSWFKEPELGPFLQKWQNCAHLDADCSLSGTCSCH